MIQIKTFESMSEAERKFVSLVEQYNISVDILTSGSDTAYLVKMLAEDPALTYLINGTVQDCQREVVKLLQGDDEDDDED